MTPATLLTSGRSSLRAAVHAEFLGNGAVNSHVALLAVNRGWIVMDVAAVIAIESPRFLKALIVGDRNRFFSARASRRSLHVATEG
jgi:stage V sporulation protein SpoVS